ncbi:hypothetical protein S-CBS2_gp007 [Synechococcus phage S-CBS2]|uniref:hypothetical protein n=1 Tax=Synechococcus phage S-CBS2 TaxID=753084 RepID=UPI00020783E0|nr:hypothetical protein S-CBS2_gp007 [Synechococcus phage S-CBS2]ADF42363.1 hypothetical protein S-CBS2_gp007 [Synechococcus phage S-CBS2]
MRKTPEEWFEQLPEPYRSQAIANRTIDSVVDIGEAHSLTEAFTVGFIWKNTPEGSNYWEKVYHMAEKGEFDTPNEDDIAPDYYGGKDNPYEAIKIIKAHDLNFCLGNVIKYVLRAGKKGDKSEDLRKAIKYLEIEIES